MTDAVTGYLDELSATLRVGLLRRRRIVAEVADHLAELVDEECTRGADRASAAQHAMARFGAPSTLASELNADAARHGLDRASRLLAIAAAAAVLAGGASLQPGAIAGPWPSGPAFSFLLQLWVQVPAVCAAIALVLTVVAPRLRGVPLTGNPAGVAARSLTLAGLLFLPVAVVAAGNLRTGMPAAEQLPLVIIAVGAPVSAICGLRAASRVSSLADPVDDEAVLDVLAATGGALADRWTVTDRAFRTAGQAWSRACARAPRTTRWLDLRRHPWRAAASASVAAGLALTAPDLLAGDPDLLASGIEAVSAYACFAALGGLLGLRGPRARGAMSRAEIAPTVNA